MDRLHEIIIRSNETTFMGRILVNEDGQFKGLAKNTAFEVQEYKLLFGQYIPNEKISLFLFHSKGQLKYIAQKTENGYKGESSIVDILGEIPYGECQIYLYPSEQIREPLENEEQQLNLLIKRNLESRKKSGLEKGTKTIPPYSRKRKPKR